MMDILSLILFLIYSLLILVILVYVSPLLSAFVMILAPVASIYILPVKAIGFFSIKQFSFVDGTVPVYNIHILLLIWSAFIGIVAYAEVLTWYLLRETPAKRIVPAAPAGKQAGSIVNQLKEFPKKLGKVLKGEKPNSKPKS
ncbi:MAG: hypothetical protein WCE94_13725 [Candidatus Methanoperedens sp.]